MCFSVEDYDKTQFEIEGTVLKKYFGTATQVIIPLGVTAIGDYAFKNCTHLESVTFPDGLTSICEGAFTGCSKLTGIAIPPGVTAIEGWAFNGCTGLREITIPKSVEYLGEGVFVSCVNLESITVEKGNAVYSSFGNCLIETQSKILVKGCINSVIPADGSVTSIGSYAFVGCDALEEIALPETIEFIDEFAFCFCLSLKKITLSKGLEEIANDAFRECRSLESVTLPEGLREIGENAFQDCRGLKSIIIPKSVTYIGMGAFWRCYETEVNCVAESKPKEWDDGWDLLSTDDYKTEEPDDDWYIATEYKRVKVVWGYDGVPKSI